MSKLAALTPDALVRGLGVDFPYPHKGLVASSFPFETPMILPRAPALRPAFITCISFHFRDEDTTPYLRRWCTVPPHTEKRTSASEAYISNVSKNIVAVPDLW
jgi:hypothetical protein